MSRPTVVGSAGGAGTSVAIPAHVAGDLLLVFAYNNASTAAPTIPTAGGTVPAWQAIDNPTGANLNSATLAGFIATATTETTGVWTNAAGIAVLVVRGNRPASPTTGSGHTQSGGAAANSSVAPGITLQVQDGSSLVLLFHGHKAVTAFGGAPAGTTRVFAAVAAFIAINSLDDTTVNPTASQTQTDTSVSGGYRGDTLEVFAPAERPPARVVGQAVMGAATRCWARRPSGIVVPRLWTPEGATI